MSITHAERFTCRCGAAVELDLVDSLNAERHPHLRQKVLDRQLHVAACAACGSTLVAEHELLYVDLGRRQILGGFRRGDRARADDCAHRLEDMFERWFRRDAAAWIRDLAGRCLVRACFGLEELREKVVADAAGLDDLALEIAKGAVLAGDPRLRAAGAATLRLDRVDDGALALIAVDADDRPCGATVQVPRADVDALARRADLAAAYPGIAVGPHVSLLRLASLRS